jgi:hypothetical protein
VYHTRAMRRATFSSVMLLLLCGAFSADAQRGVRAQAALDWRADDAKRVAELTTTGERREGRLVVLFTPSGLVADPEEAALLERLDKGVQELRAVVGRQPRLGVGEEKISYYVSRDQFVAHATGRSAVFIPLIRHQEGRAPYLHEAAHELLRAKRPPLWLSEGMADFVALTAATRAGVPEGDVFAIGGLSGADTACRERLKGPRGTDILPFIGGFGRPAALFTTERREVAPIFYACALSFTSFVVERIGLPQALGLMPLTAEDGVLTRIEELTSISMEALRAEWRSSIGFYSSR